mgnify:CR=1 FL=1
MKLTHKLRETFRDDQLKMRLALALEVSYPTITRWIANEDEKLSTRRAVKAIEAITGLTEDDMFAEQAM